MAPDIPTHTKTVGRRSWGLVGHVKNYLLFCVAGSVWDRGKTCLMFSKDHGGHEGMGYVCKREF